MLELLTQKLVHLPDKFFRARFLMIRKSKALHEAPNDTVRFLELISVGINLCQHDAKVLLQRQFTKQLQVERLAKPITTPEHDACSAVVDSLKEVGGVTLNYVRPYRERPQDRGHRAEAGTQRLKCLPKSAALGVSRRGRR
jgi:hypothetical protein